MKLGIFVSCGYCYVDCLVVALVSALSTTQELGQRRTSLGRQGLLGLLTGKPCDWPGHLSIIFGPVCRSSASQLPDSARSDTAIIPFSS